MEYFDIIDEYGNPTGEIIERSEAHRIGARHRTAHIWVLRKNGDKTEILLQKRAMNKDSFPGRFDTSSAGHIQAGDEPLESARRELSEELGIHASPDDLLPAGTFKIQYEKEFYGKMFKDNEIAYVYVYKKDVDITKLVLQKEEIESVEWFDLEETMEEVKKHNHKFCVPFDGLVVLKDYLEKRKNEKTEEFGMSIGIVREELKRKGFEDRIIEFDSSSATVHLAAEVLGCKDADICKTMSFLVGDDPVVICVAGDKKVDNHKYKETFGVKAKMIPGDVLESLTGHAPGGCCPFGLKDNVKIYFDVSLKSHDIIYPAAGTDASAVRLTVDELEKIVNFERYVDVTKDIIPSGENHE